MGRKLPKNFGDKVPQPGPLADQLLNDTVAQPTGRVKHKPERHSDDEEFVDGSLGRNIIKQSLAQLKEIDQEDEETWPALGAPVKKKRKEKFKVSLTKSGFKKTTKKRIGPKEDSDSDEANEEEPAFHVPLDVDKFMKGFETELNLHIEDISVLDHFKRKNENPHQCLADLFRDKITEKQTEINSEIGAQSTIGGLSPELQSMCKDIGKVLSHYRSGPLPKMFKVFPVMNCWEELVFLTEPDKWSAAAMYQATRIFISNLSASMAQRFCYFVLLPRIRDDISFYKRLNYHLYQALCKALFKSAAFFKGIILPLCSVGDCTLREAIILGSVIAKNHIPIINSAAAIKKIASFEYSGANSIFLRIFFDKKYALPYQVLDECVDHFKRFEREVRNLPVLWHQSLLAFVQHYKNDISADQKRDLFTVMNVHSHHKVTPQIRRELIASQNREQEQPMAVD